MAGISYIFSHTHTQILKERKREREIMRKTEMLTLREKERERERGNETERERGNEKEILFICVCKRETKILTWKERKSEG